MSKTLEYDCSMCGVHLICNGEGIPEPKVCLSCKDKYVFLRNMIHDYIKENLKLTLERERGSNFIYLYVSIEDEEIYQDCVDIEDL